MAKRAIDILGAGNLSILKNYALFIDIVALLKPDFPNLRTEICGGDAGQRTVLEAQITQLGLQENIILTGTLSHRDVLEKMNNSTVFLHTSKSEGGGTVLQEALYSGCYVAGTIPVEDWQTMDCFYYSAEKEILAAKIKAALLKKNAPKRVEKFSMEATIKVIADAFGQ
ncbi:glycosyltransferase [Flavobacterium sp. 3HN19-14]|uniref:glycosyltransferase n=1 Tax=Flavobacterium sp. 3HN19-14 TaxID=3448133 RepID=UPI003EE0B603